MILKYFRSLILLVIITLPVMAQKQKSSRPNIIYMMSDDHGYQAISAYGHGLNQTPNIDKLGEQGMLFNRAYVTNSICGPSRAVMLTGKHSHVNGFMDNHSTFDGNQQTVAKLMHDAGYQTAVVGKWHLISDPQGFDYWNIVPAQGDYYNPDFIENGVHKRIPGYVTNVTTDIAINWLEKRDKNKPFFLIYQQKAPHRNWMPEEKYYHLFDSVQFKIPDNYFDNYATRTKAAREQEMEIATDMHYAYDLKLAFDLPKEKQTGLGANWQGIYNRLTVEEKKKWEAAYGPSIEAFNKANLTGKELAIWKYQRYMRDYLRCVQSVDDNVGRLMDYLNANGLDENTIVIYTSDQGFYLGEHGWFDKRFMYEESFRTPLIVKWPGVTNKKLATNTMVQNLDFAETILDMAGLPIPSDMQGKSFVPLLKGTQKGNLHDALYYHFYENKEHKVAKHIGARTDRFKLIYFYENNEWELYDLKNDKSEMNNVYNDPSYKKVQLMMKNTLVDLMKQYNDQVPALTTDKK
ncbi:sulfatase [Solitalea lacus]|uniref:sulfatase family protein n=1 Tax=Solitalea lacus TaxID=2911172 RepID=UPI001EDADD8D|nr:sulfatase [Solitalea lacus]UKJ09319.1 sulfatase [Solitalea lacus]